MIERRPLLTRKDIALIYGVTELQVRRNEVRWGLHRARTKLKSNPILYRALMVQEIMIALGVV